MADLVHQLIFESAQRVGERPALKYRDDVLTYRQLAEAVQTFASALMKASSGTFRAVAVYAEKRIKTIVSMFGASAARAHVRSPQGRAGDPYLADRPSPRYEPRKIAGLPPLLAALSRPKADSIGQVPEETKLAGVGSSL
jgi:hypothetical protein